jgi:RNA 2',3'-cyclic 3'-phosphodiesterase
VQRLFVAIELPAQLKLRLSSLCVGVPGARWVQPGNLHLTLRFIGAVDDPIAANISSALLCIKAPGLI